MNMAPKIAGDPEIATAFEQHVTETAAHEQLIRARLQRRDAGPSPLKDVAGKVTGQGFALFAKFQPDTPGKLVAHAYSYEHMELAAYDLLGRVAERARDPETVEVAGRILSEERTMAERLSLLFDRAVEASLREQQTVDLDALLNAYLEDAHALEAQANELLGEGVKIAGADELVIAFKEHLARTREHARLIDARLTRAVPHPPPPRMRRLRSGRSTGAPSSALSRTRRSSSPVSHTPTSTSRSPATNCCAASPDRPATTRPRRSPSGSSPRSGPPPSGSTICSTLRSMPRCARRR
jgi:ferritin-like metal-binding protein YciE